MNPKDPVPDILKDMRRFNDVFAAWTDAERRMDREAANGALADLCSALGADLDGAAFDGDYKKVTLPVGALKLITSRLRALADGNLLADGAL